MMLKNKQSGFTLIEMVVVISIVAIIASLSSSIIGRALESYAALDRRNQLQASIRLVLERISREVRNSVPYSVCVYNGSNCSTSPQDKFYFIPVKDSGRYQHLNRVNGDRDYTGTNIRRRRLRIANSDDRRLDILSTNAKNRLNAIGNIDTPAPYDTGDWLVVFNINNTDIYQPVTDGTNDANVRHQIYSITTRDIQGDGDPTNDIDYIQFTDYDYTNDPPDTGQVGFANHSPSKRFQIIANDVVTLFYKDGRNLYRDTTTFADPATPTVNTRLLMENVEACTFTYIGDGVQNAVVLRIDLTVEIQGERVQVVHEAQVYNAP